MTKKSFIKFLGLLLVVGLLFAAAPVGQAQAATVTVNPGESIQAAIDAASAGDTIIVAAGTYTENIVIDKRLTLQGAGSDSTIISSAADDLDVIKLTTGGTSTTDRMVIKDLKVTGAKGTASYVSGINIDNGLGFITLDHVAVVGNVKDGVHINNVVMTDIELLVSTISGNGGSGILVRYAGGAAGVDGLKLMNCVVESNSNGLYMYRVTGLYIDGGSYSNNKGPVDTDGVGIYAADSSQGGLNKGFTSPKPNVIKNVSVSGNSRGIILNMYGGSDYTFENIILNNNNADDTDNGQGITLGWRGVVSSKVTLKNITATGNEKSNIWVIAYADTNLDGLVIENCTVSGSTLSGNGYGLYLYSATTGVISNATISGCEVSGNNTGIYFRASAPASAANIGNKANFNNITGNTVGVNNTDTDNVFDATKNWWGLATGPAAGEISGSVNTTPWYATATTTPETEKVTVKRGETVVAYSDTIQGAIDAASAGDIINVAPGEYVEVGQIVIDKNLTIVGADKATTIIKPAQNTGASADARGWWLVNVGVQFNLSNVTLDGAGKLVSIGILSHGTGTIENNIIKNISYNPSGPDYAGRGIAIYDADMTIKNNLLQNIGRIGIYVYGTDADQVVIDGNTYEGKGIGDWLDYGIEIEGGADAEVKNNLIKNCTGVASVDGSGSAGLLITTYFAPGSTANIHDNEFNGNSVGINVGYDSTDTSSVVAEKNQLLNNVTAIVTTAPAVDGSPNWWGNAAGPGASQISGTVDFTPWCTDATCLHTAPDASGNVNLSGNISVPGGILINEPGITYHLAANTVIENNSPCFVIEASNTIIEAEPGAKCIPTGGSNGIDVADGLNNITIDGLEIDGSGQDTGDGIHFAGAVTDIVLVDNYLHGLDSDGIEFAGDVAEIVNIQGNMFKNNTGYGINNLGTTTVGAEYNSWGDVAGPAAGDGVNGAVTSTPFTHADLYLASSGTPWANQVVKGQNITYTVMAHLVNVNAADFVLTYPAELTYVSDTPSSTMGTASVVHDETAHTLHFIGYNTVNVTGDLPLFSATFTGATVGANLPLSFSYAETSGFGMVGFESSTNVFVNEMVNGAVTVIDLPTISSTDIQGYYLTGEQRQFSVILDNPSTGADYAHVYVDFTIANAQVEQIDAIEYSVDNGTTWVALGTGPGTHIANSGPDVVGYFGKITGGGFPLASGDTLTTLFRVTFKTREQGATDFPNSYSISMSLKDADTADPDTELAAFTKTAYVYDKPTLTSTDIQGYYLVGEERAFHVQVVNPATGGSFTSIYYNFEIADAVSADIASLVCGGQTISLSQSGTKLVGSTGPFPMPAGQSWNTPCSVKFNTAKNYAFTVYMTDSIPDPDRTLVTYTQTAKVYTPPTLTSDDIDGPYLAGVPQDFHVTVNNPATGGSFVDSIYYVFTIADAELEDIYSLVCDGNSVTFTQSGSSLVGRTGYGSHGFPMPAGQEWITTCNVLFKNAGSYTFTVDMVDNPSGVIANDRVLVSMSQTATVNSGFAITGTFSMQGNASRAGIPVTLTWAGTGWTYGPSANTTSAISNNFSLSVLYGGEYTITTLQPRYLNVYADTLFSKKITVAGPYNMSALILKGGNAYWRVSDTVLDNTINTSDSSIVGTQYGGAGSDAGFGNHGDCNFDGTVNIQDLALVGGNWSLTSATAYTTWLP